MLQVIDLTKRYGAITAADGVSFSVARGESFGLVGPNGAGKTTTISVVAGVIRPDRGEVAINGVSMLRQTLEAKRRLGLVPQEVALYQSLSADENLAFWGRLHGLRGRRLRERRDAVLELVGLTDRRRSRVSTYSGGMKRRLNIAVALLHEPELLVLDEPTVGVDPQSRHHILESVRRLQALGVTVIYTSHYMEEVERVCDRVAIMDRGRIIAAGSLAELHREVAGDRVLHLTPGPEADRAALSAALAEVPGLGEHRWRNDTLEVLAAEGEDLLPLVLERLHSAGVRLRRLRVEEPDLESLFLKLTGRQLRD